MQLTDTVTTDSARTTFYSGSAAPPTSARPPMPPISKATQNAAADKMITSHINIIHGSKTEEAATRQYHKTMGMVEMAYAMELIAEGVYHIRSEEARDALNDWASRHMVPRI